MQGDWHRDVGGGSEGGVVVGITGCRKDGEDGGVSRSGSGDSGGNRVGATNGNGG